MNLLLDAEPRELSVDGEGRQLTVTVVRSLCELAALAEPWRALHAASAGDSAFLSWEWLYSWAERFVRGERELFLIAMFDGTKLVAIAPWYIDRVSHGPVRAREITFLGLPEAGSDYLDVVTRRGRERQIARVLTTLLFGPLSSSWDVLNLRDVPAESAFLARFIAHIRRSGKHYQIEEGSFCPGVRLPETFDAYLQQLSSHGRQAYRRKMRTLLANEGVQHVVLHHDRDMRCGLKTFRELYETRWGKTATTEDLFALVEAYHARATAWRIELSLLRVQERTVAGLLHFTHGRTMCQYLMAVDRSFNESLSIGHLVCGMNIACAIKRGFREYDFLKTEEDYKFRFMTAGRRSLNLRVHNRTLRSLGSWATRSVSGLAKIVLR
ncbi:MAG TPA: GNAT family N-acetyltransferase [Vicinamibacterales bacterium]|nr:GNAT family N-acetyltransferase [Vicinamibacterales bacterium]